MRVLTLLGGIAWGAPTPSAPADGLSMIILGGGKTAEDAAAWRRDRKAALGVLAKEIVLPPEYPRDVASADVEGLNAGFHIVVAGVCPAAEADAVLARVRRVIPEAYTKTVRVPPEQIACPRPGLSLALVTFHDADGRCGVTRTAPGQPDQDWGSVPGACPKRAWREVSATRTPEGRVVVGFPTGVIERAHDGTVQTLPSLGPPWVFDWTGMDLQGSVLVGARFGGPDAGSSGRSRWVIDGRAVEFEWEPGSKSAVLCGVFFLGSSGWQRNGLRPRGLPPNAPQPVCSPSGIGWEARPLLRQPTERVGPPAEGGPTGGLFQLDGPFAAAADGAAATGPLWFTGAQPWRQVAGFEGKKPLALQSLDGAAIACTEGHAAVLSADDGTVIWTAKHCPIAWEQ